MQKEKTAQIVIFHSLYTLLCGIGTLLELPAKPIWWLADKCKWRVHDLKWPEDTQHD